MGNFQTPRRENGNPNSNPNARSGDIRTWRQARPLIAKVFKVVIAAFYLPVIIRTIKNTFDFFSKDISWKMPSQGILLLLAIAGAAFLVNEAIYRRKMSPEKLTPVFHQEGEDAAKLKTAFGMVFSGAFGMGFVGFVSYGILMEGVRDYAFSWVFIVLAFLSYKNTVRKFDTALDHVAQLSAI